MSVRFIRVMNAKFKGLKQMKKRQAILGTADHLKLKSSIYLGFLNTGSSTCFCLVNIYETKISKK